MILVLILKRKLCRSKRPQCQLAPVFYCTRFGTASSRNQQLIDENIQKAQKKQQATIRKSRPVFTFFMVITSHAQI